MVVEVLERRSERVKAGITFLDSATHIGASLHVQLLSPTVSWFLLAQPVLVTSIMAIGDIVSDPSLLPVLHTSAETQDQCQKLLALLDPTADLSSESPDSSNPALTASKQQKQLFAQLAQLRGQNRDAIFGVRDTKQSTAEARQEIDRLHLQLQNLYYEQRHLTGEIAACESYEYVNLGPEWC